MIIDNAVGFVIQSKRITTKTEEQEMKKRLIVFMVIAVMLCTFGVVSAQEDASVKLIVDNRVIPTETVTVNDRTLVPLRTIMEGMGAEVEWHGETEEIDIIGANGTLRMKIGSNIMQTPSGELEIDVAPMLYNGETTYVPTRAISEASGSRVEWDEGTKTVLITSSDGLPYVDFYEGRTLEQQLAKIGMTPKAFSEQTGLDYDEYKDKPYVLADNSISVGKVASINGMSLEDLRQVFGFGENVSSIDTWGEALGEITLRTYIEKLTNIGLYGVKADEVFDEFKEYYGLGEEYSLETEYRFVRVIMDSKELEIKTTRENMEKAEAEAEANKKAADEAELSELCKEKIFFTITLEDGSQMRGELYPKVAPKTVENFVKLCDDGFYDGLIFHRVIDDFMIQGGGYYENMQKKEAETIAGEFYENGITNALKHERGVISMARSSYPDSASSEFFIMDEAAPHLDGSYAAFGRITEGFDVLDKIAESETHSVNAAAENGGEFGMSIVHENVPIEAVIIKSIVIER